MQVPSDTPPVPEEAFEILRRSARSKRAPLRVVADAVVRGLDQQAG